MASYPPVKREPGVKQEDGMAIKSEPGTVGSPIAEDDPLEDAGDVEFYDTENTQSMNNNMYLVRIPRNLWDVWSKLEDDAEIELGTIRQIEVTGQPVKMQMRLRNDLAQHQDLPKEYNLDVTSEKSKNQFIFSERDLPNYVTRNKEKERAIANGIPTHLLRKRQQAQDGQTEEPQAKKSRRERYAEQEKRSIPKKTKIEGRVAHEMNCVPMDNAETEMLMIRNSLKAHEQKKGPKFVSDLAPDSLIDDRNFSGFIKHREPPKPAKKSDNKNARWAENVLLDKLFECFAEKQYWPMKAIKQRVPQPEAYIREHLNRIATLQRQGSFANTWTLTDQYKRMLEAQKGVSAATNESIAEIKDEPEEDDEDEDLNMEDAL